jgi:hypothetical protein
MKIKYQKLIRSTDIEPSVLLERMVAELNKAGYQITNQTQSSVEFKNNIWGPGSRTDVFKKVDGGKFNISLEEKTVIFSYYLSPAFEILAFCVVAFFGIVRDYHILFFIVFIALMFFIRIISQKIAGNRMMENLLDPELS